MPIVVAALPIIIVALVAMILIWGADLLFKSILQSMANHVPLIGGSLSRAVGAIVSGAVSLASSAARAVISDTIGLLLAPVYWIERHIVSTINFFSNLVDAIAYITTSLIPAVVRELSADVNAALSKAYAYTQAEASALQAEINHVVAAIYTTIGDVESSLERYAQQLTAAAEAYTAAEINAVTSYIQSTVSALETEISHVATAETQYAQALYTDAVTYAQSLVSSAQSALVTDITNVIDWTGQQVTELDASIAAVAASAAAFTLDAVGTVETALDDLKSGCTDNLCSGLSELADIFNALQGDLGLVALFTLAAEFAADPRGAAAEVQSTLGPVAQGAAGAVRDLIGL